MVTPNNRIGYEQPQIYCLPYSIQIWGVDVTYSPCLDLDSHNNQDLLLLSYHIPLQPHLHVEWPHQYLETPQTIRLIHRLLAVRCNPLYIRLEIAARNPKQLHVVLYSRFFRFEVEVHAGANGVSEPVDMSHNVESRRYAFGYLFNTIDLSA